MKGAVRSQEKLRSVSVSTHLSVLVNDFSSDNGHGGYPATMQTFEYVEITSLMLRGRGDHLRAFGIPDDTIAIGSDRHSTFLRIDVEDARCIGTGDGNELIDIQFASFDALRPNDR